VSPTCYTIRFATLTPPYNTTRERIFLISRLLGHSNPTVTQNIYVDPFLKLYVGQARLSR
jgi:integrase